MVKVEMNEADVIMLGLLVRRAGVLLLSADLDEGKASRSTVRIARSLLEDIQTVARHFIRKYKQALEKEGKRGDEHG